MAVSITTTTSGVIVLTGSTVTVSYSHTANRDMLVIVGFRSSSLAIVGVTYDGAAMTEIVASTQGGADPGPRMSAFRINDPGTKTANIVVTFGGVSGSCIIYGIDVAGCPTTNPIDSSGSISGTAEAQIIVTHTRISNTTYTIFAACRNRGASALTYTSDSPLVEIYDEEGVANTLAATLASCQEIASGSLARSVTPSTIIKYAAVAVSYLTAADPGPPVGGATRKPGVLRSKGRFTTRA